MGVYLNPDNTSFEEALNSEIYVDKSNLIIQTNSVLRTKQKYICVSRPRRFGKSMAADMLVAYYSKGCNSKAFFADLKIAESKSFLKHLNQYNVIHINMVDFFDTAASVEKMIDYLESEIIAELNESYPNITVTGKKTFNKVLMKIFDITKVPFIFIIDEWDCLMRSKKVNADSQTIYLDYLRDLLKDKTYVALTYMTGILPIKKYGEHSALNMFKECSMTNQKNYAEFTGFTENEVKTLCQRYNLLYESMKQWYNGYCVNGISIYNPKSVVEALIDNAFDNYWTKTETYEALKVYIEMDFDSLKHKVSQMLAGDRVKINPDKFQNDMTTMKTSDDVLTLLVHLGYLTFDSMTSEVWIPNSEVQQEFINVLEDGGWEEIMDLICRSQEILNMTLSGDEDGIGKALREVHRQNTSILQYNDENSLSYVISYAYFAARKDYVMYRELPSGEGFADIVFVPRRTIRKPAIIVELKYKKSAVGAIEQIKKNVYADCLKDYKGEIILVGINYEKNNKEHICKIERIEK